MKTPSDLLPAVTDTPSGQPLARQIEQRLRTAIRSGEQAAGSRLPSARALAAQLGVARGTVEDALGALKADGLVLTRGAAGSFVAADAARMASAAPRRLTPPPATTDMAAPLDWPLHPAMPALDRFPRKLWSRLAVRQARGFLQGDHLPPDPRGHLPLRRAIAGHLRLARGVEASPEQVFVTAGFQGGLGLVCLALLASGEPVRVEDPGYFLAREALAGYGAVPVGVPVDAEGMDVAAGIRLAPEARLTIVTPAHQSPLGMAMSLPRRVALLEHAAARDGWIVEDDYDGEFRYASRPLSTLYGQDSRGRVIHAGTFSKCLSPALRLGYLVVPPALVERFRAAASALRPSGDSLGQDIVAAFIAEGHLARHVRRMRLLYARRRDALAGALGDRFSDRLRIELADGGMHLLVWPDTTRDDRALARSALAAGLAPTALSLFRMRQAGPPGLLLGFANLEAARAAAIVERLFAALDLGAV